MLCDGADYEGTITEESRGTEDCRQLSNIPLPTFCISIAFAVHLLAADSVAGIDNACQLAY